MLFLKEEIPAKVSMNEAIEIAKVYWDDSSKKIVNGVLNKLMTQIDEVLTLSQTFDYSQPSFSYFKK
jgi:transcription termination factor NusB